MKKLDGFASFDDEKIWLLDQIALADDRLKRAHEAGGYEIPDLEYWAYISGAMHALREVLDRLP